MSLKLWQVAFYEQRFGVRLHSLSKLRDESHVFVQMQTDYEKGPISLIMMILMCQSANQQQVLRAWQVCLKKYVLIYWQLIITVHLLALIINKWGTQYLSKTGLITLVCVPNNVMVLDCIYSNMCLGSHYDKFAYCI